jgi:hypothetical protein
MLIYINLLCDSNFSPTERKARIYEDKTVPGKNGIACNGEPSVVLEHKSNDLSIPDVRVGSCPGTNQILRSNRKYVSRFALGTSYSSDLPVNHRY